MTQFAMEGGMHDYTVNAIRKAVFTSSLGAVEPAAEYTDADLEWADKKNLNKKRVMYKGRGWQWHNFGQQIIEGRLFGGCLESLELHLAVKRYLPDFSLLKDTILYLETSEEMPSDGFVYRFLAALAELKILNQFQAILMGYPKAQFCERYPPEGREAFMENQQLAVKSALRDYNVEIPVIFNLNFGHTDPQIPIPNGDLVKIDPKLKTIEFL